MTYGNGLGSSYPAFGYTQPMDWSNDLFQSINSLGNLNSPSMAYAPQAQTYQIPNGPELMQMGQDINSLMMQTLMALRSAPAPMPTNQGVPVQGGGTIAPAPSSTLNPNASNTNTTSDPATDSQTQLSQSLQDVNSSGVNQGKYGDCVFEASLASMASSPDGKQKISKMISVNPDGSYKVTFPGDPSNPVTVTKEDLEKYEVQDSALWAKVIETAYVKSHPKEAEGNFDGTLAKDQTPAQWALHLLAGNDASKATASDQDMGSKLDQALNKDHHSVVACCTDDNGKVLVSGHEWTVTAYDPSSKTVTVRNPWGHNDLKPGETKNGVTALENGEMKMSLETFQKHYGEVTTVDS
jgi:hypothetical protein